MRIPYECASGFVASASRTLLELDRCFTFAYIIIHIYILLNMMNDGFKFHTYSQPHSDQQITNTCQYLSFLTLLPSSYQYLGIEITRVSRIHTDESNNIFIIVVSSSCFVHTLAGREMTHRLACVRVMCDRRLAPPLFDHNGVRYCFVTIILNKFFSLATDRQIFTN